MHKRKIWTAAIIVLLLCAIIGVAYYLFHDESIDIQQAYSDTSFETLSQTGAFSFDNNYLSFGDPSTGKRVLICNDAGCTHSGAACSAYFDGVVYGVSIAGDKLVYVSDEGCTDKMVLILQKCTMIYLKRK